MTVLRALIADDEKPARKRLLDLLESVPEVEVVAVCASGEEAIQAIGEHAPDLVFLDIQMPEVDGFAVIDTIGVTVMPVTIFVTAYDQYALRAFDAHAVDYLLKPFSDERFDSALQRAMQFVQSEKRDNDVLNRMTALLETVRPAAPRYLDRIVLKARGRVSLLKVDEIAWIEAAGVYVKLHAGQATPLHRESLSRLEEQLDPQQFIRIHRSTIVNIEHIAELRSDAHGDYTVLLHDGTPLKLSRTYRERLQTRLGQPF